MSQFIFPPHPLYTISFRLRMNIPALRIRKYNITIRIRYVIANPVPVLKSYFEVFVLGVGRGFFDFSFAEVSAEFFGNIPYAIIDSFGRALSKHLNGAVEQISDKAGQPAAVGYVKCGKAKANTLDPANENYMFCCLAHYAFYINSKRPSIQAGVVKPN